jgi:hypothetical protein
MTILGWCIRVRDRGDILFEERKKDKAESPAPSQGSGQAKGQPHKDNFMNFATVKL